MVGKYSDMVVFVCCSWLLVISCGGVVVREGFLMSWSAQPLKMMGIMYRMRKMSIGLVVNYLSFFVIVNISWTLRIGG